MWGFCGHGWRARIAQDEKEAQIAGTLWLMIDEHTECAFIQDDGVTRLVFDVAGIDSRSRSSREVWLSRVAGNEKEIEFPMHQVRDLMCCQKAQFFSWRWCCILNPVNLSALLTNGVRARPRQTGPREALGEQDNLCRLAWQEKKGIKSNSSLAIPADGQH